jgi:hypothetical protein
VDGQDGGVVLQRTMARTSISLEQSAHRKAAGRITTSLLRFRQVTTVLHYPNSVHVTMATCSHR